MLIVGIYPPFNPLTDNLPLSATRHTLRATDNSNASFACQELNYINL